VPKPKKGLGRSFESLIPTELLDESFDVTIGQDDKVSDLRLIKFSEIHPDPDQPRQHFDEEALIELSQSIKEHGIIQPLVVTPDAKGGYIIVAGERRYRASQLIGLDRLPVLVRTLTDQHKLELSIIENVQRRDLTAIETATAYAKLRDQFNLTLEQIGVRVGGRSVSTISNTLRLLRLPYSAKEALADNQISEGQARPLIGVDTVLVDRLVPQIIAEKWSAREVERAVSSLRGTEVTGKKALPKKSSLAPVEKKVLDHLEKTVGTKVKIVTTPTGSGSIALKFKSIEERQRLIDLLDR
jgi:ParB family transcriptional regulator, chromosome partitioning protein